MSDGVILIICLVIIVIFVGVIVYWLIRNSKPYTINDSVKGLYAYAQLGQLCATGITGTSVGDDSLFLPGYFQPQNCDTGLACIPINNNSEYGYCKAKLNNYCTNVYDCAPPSFAGGSGTSIFCSGGLCTQTPLGVLFSSCGATGGTGGTGPIGLECDTIDLNLICSNGTCLGNLGFGCTSQNECASGLFCDTTANQCIAPIPPTGLCNGDYCTTGFGCTGGVCEPLFPITGTNQFFAPQPGEIKSFCNPGTSAVSPFACNNNLICNIDTYLNAPTSSPGVTGIFSGITGFGLCAPTLLPAGSVCSSVGNACIPPLVCYDGTCRAPVVGGVPDINYCGPNSTGLCDLTGIYTCVNDGCQPNISGLCNGGTGYCNTGSCTGNKLGIFTLDRSGVTGTPNIGTWQYLDLPAGETGPSNRSTLSTFQNMEIDISGNPITKTKCIYYPYYMASSPYFWLAEFESGATGYFTVSNNWTKYFITNTGGIYTIDGVKFTHGGNVSIKYYLTTDAMAQSYVNVYNGYISGNLDFTTQARGPMQFTITATPRNVLDWDVDDVYNQAVVGLNFGANTATAIFDSLPVSPGPVNITSNWGVTGATGATWCKYYIDQGGGSPGLFMVGIDNTIQGPVFGSITLQEPQSTGAGFFTTFSNYYAKFELYYTSDRSYRYVNSITTSYIPPVQTTEDLPIEGYTPDFAQSSTATPNPAPGFTNINYIATMSMGNIDARLFSLVTICQ